MVLVLNPYLVVNIDNGVKHFLSALDVHIAENKVDNRSVFVGQLNAEVSTIGVGGTIETAAGYVKIAFKRFFALVF